MATSNPNQRPKRSKKFRVEPDSWIVTEAVELVAALMHRLDVMGRRGERAARILARRNATLARASGQDDRRQVASPRLDPQRLDQAPVRTEYEVEAGAAFQLAFEDGERFHVEPAGGEFGLAWTTSLPRGALLARVRSMLHPDAAVGVVFNVRGDFREASGSPRDAVRLLEEADPVFWRLDLADRAITWERGDWSVGTPAFAQMGFIGATRDRSFLTSLVRDTGTPLIGANAESIMSDCWHVIDAALPPTTQETA